MLIASSRRRRRSKSRARARTEALARLDAMLFGLAKSEKTGSAPALASMVPAFAPRRMAVHTI